MEPSSSKRASRRCSSGAVSRRSKRGIVWTATLVALHCACSGVTSVSVLAAACAPSAPSASAPAQSAPRANGRAANGRFSQWHDGQAFSASDVEYSLQRTQATDYSGPFRAQFKDVQSVQTVDPLKLRVTLSQPNASFLAASMRELKPIPKHLVQNQDLRTVCGKPWTLADAGVDRGPVEPPDLSSAAPTCGPSPMRSQRLRVRRA
jgi:Bacterial extracellular solute-binding proteins, family 5 Middle